MQNQGFSANGFDLSFAVGRLEQRLEQLGNVAYKSDPGRSQTAIVGGLEVQSGSRGLKNDASIHEWAKVPQSVGLVKPIGVGELKVVEQELLCYGAGEIAHVENILAGEAKERTTRRLNRTEETLIEEQENIKEEERDSQTTERFAMQKESSKVLQKEMQIQAGVSVTASYGPVFVTADAGFSAGSSSYTSENSSEEYAKEVTERARTRVVERVRREKVTTIIREFEETNLHAIDNVGSPDHIVGVYRWLDKTYLAGIRNYGKRLMFQFMVPEPAAFYKHAKANGPQTEGVLSPPVDPKAGHGNLPPLRTHRDLDGANYFHWAGLYEVSDFTPPPPMFQIASLTKHLDPIDGGSGDRLSAASSMELTVPEGYFARSGAVLAGLEYFYNSTTEQKANMRVFIGKKVLGFSHSPNPPQKHNITKYTPLDLETGPLPISWSAGHSNIYLLNIEVLCERTPHAYEAWQIKTFNAIMGGYRKKLSDYEDAKASATGLIQILGNNPDRNREIEQEELKKSSISLISGQKFEAFDAMKDSVPPLGYPEFNDPQAINEGDYIQFFEHAFEWRNMTYQFYPYFWSRKEKWPEMMQFEDNDPLFTKFLQAGSARVIVPVRPGYENLIFHYLSSGGEIWRGGEVPKVEDELFLSIADELEDPEYSDEGEPWEIRIPTSLVMLQQNDGGLPDQGLPCFRDELFPGTGG